MLNEADTFNHSFIYIFKDHRLPIMVTLYDFVSIKWKQ